MRKLRLAQPLSPPFKDALQRTPAFPSSSKSDSQAPNGSKCKARFSSSDLQTRSHYFSTRQAMYHGRSSILRLIGETTRSSRVKPLSPFSFTFVVQRFPTRRSEKNSLLTDLR